MFINFDIDEMNESEIHSLKQENRKLKTQIEERDICIIELQKKIEKIQETLDQDFVSKGDIYEVYRLTEKAVNSAILLCKNSEDSVIQKIEERRNK